MTRAYLLAATAAFALTTAAPAQAPRHETPAPIAYLLDLSSGAELLAKNADQRIPPASMAKMMATELVFELIASGKLAPDKMCTVRPETWRQWHGPQAGSTMFLSADEQVSVENLLHGVVTLSGNDASVVLAECIAGTEQAFARQMTELGRQLGMRSSRFCNATGWPDEGCTFTTARDLAVLARASIERHPALYKQYYGQPSFTWGRTLAGEAITQPNRNPLLGRIQGADGLKTGHTQEAGYGYSGSAEQDGRRLVMVVAGLQSWDARVQESVRLMRWGFEAWQTRPLFEQGASVGSAQVQLGSRGEVPLVAPRHLAATYPAGLSGEPRLKIRYDGPIKAPIEQGQHIADLIVEIGSSPPQVMPLVAGEAVGAAGFFTRAWIGLKQLLGLA